MIPVASLNEITILYLLGIHSLNFLLSSNPVLTKYNPPTECPSSFFQKWAFSQSYEKIPVLCTLIGKSKREILCEEAVCKAH